MKIYSLFLIGLLVVCSCTKSKEQPAETTAAAESILKPAEQLRHVVLFKFKESATAADIAKIEAAFIALPSQIEEVKGFEWGLNNSPEGVDKGFTHCYFLTFDSEEGRAAYLPHPAHKAFGEVIGPHLEDVLVVDYWAL